MANAKFLDIALVFPGKGTILARYWVLWGVAMKIGGTHAHNCHGQRLGGRPRAVRPVVGSDAGARRRD
jgi:hypothetical protein